MTKLKHHSGTKASYKHRFFAIAIDWIVMAAFYYFLNHYKFGNGLIRTLITTIFFLCYKAFMEFRWGASFGKILMGIKVIDKSGEKPKLKHIIIRNMVSLCQDLYKITVSVVHFNQSSHYKISKFKFYNPYGNVIWLIIIVYVIDIWYMVKNNKNRCLHDRWSGTMVVYK